MCCVHWLIVHWHNWNKTCKVLFFMWKIHFRCPDRTFKLCVKSFFIYKVPIHKVISWHFSYATLLFTEGQLSPMSKHLATGRPRLIIIIMIGIWLIIIVVAVGVRPQEYAGINWDKYVNAVYCFKFLYQSGK